MKRAALIGLLVLAVLAVFYLQRKGYSDHEHERFQSALWRLKRLDSSFNEDLLRARFSLLENYDRFQTYQREMEQLVGSALLPPRFVGPGGEAEITQATRELTALLQTRRQWFERFKSLNAVLSNSRRYFPTAVDELDRRLAITSEADHELDHTVHELTRALLAHGASADVSTAQMLDASAPLLAWVARHPDHPEAAFASSLARHARALLDGKSELDELTRHLLALPTSAGIERLSRSYEHDLSLALRRTAQYQTLLCGLVILLAAVIGYALWVLRTANRGLGKRVDERTAALQHENAERKRAEGELAASLAVLQATLESTADGIIACTADGKVVNYNAHFASMWGFPAEDLKRWDVPRMTAFVAAKVRDEHQFTQRVVELVNAPPREAAHDVLELKDGRTFERYVKAQQIDGATTGLVANFRDVTARCLAEAELGRVHSQLLDTSRQAGMAEVATSVLHNVGNVLNSVNVSATLVADLVRRSKAPNVAKVHELLIQNRAELGPYLTDDPKGRVIPAYLATLSESLVAEQAAITAELGNLNKNIDHIKSVVAMQQSYAKTSGVVESVSVPDLVEDAIRMNAASLARHDVDVVRECACRPVISVEKNKVLQILVNLIRNAKHACDDSGRTDKRIVIRTDIDEKNVQISVSDNGVGIPPENLTRIFAHGFTTRKHGHGFGLHSGALAAKELGGALAGRSDGPGHGASFTLTLPLQSAADPS